MERVRLRREKAGRALSTLEEVLREPYSLLVRDATVQRFEYTFEAMWKSVREYLRARKGISRGSPKDCFRELLAQGVLSEQETVAFLEMTDMRNLTSHTYEEEVAAKIYAKVGAYANLLRSLLDRLSEGE